MYSILVLGLIPGTNIQVSFVAWLAVSAIAATFVLVLLVQYYRNRREIWLPAHYPKHANQLHQRGV